MQVCSIMKSIIKSKNAYCDSKKHFGKIENSGKMQIKRDNNNNLVSYESVRTKISPDQVLSEKGTPEFWFQ